METLKFNYTAGQMTITLPSSEVVQMSLEDAVALSQNYLDRHVTGWAEAVKAGTPLRDDQFAGVLCDELAPQIEAKSDFELGMKLMEGGFPSDFNFLRDIRVALSRAAAGYHASAAGIAGTGMAPTQAVATA